MEKRWLSAYDSGVPASINYPEVPVHQPFFEAAARNPNAAAVIDRDLILSYADLAARVTSFSRALAELGVGKGTNIGILLPNLPELIVAYYGVLATGATAVMLNPALVAREFEQMVADAGFETLVTLDELKETIMNARERCGLETVIVVRCPRGAGGGDPIPAPDTIPFEALVEQGGPQFEPPAVDAREDVALLIYTGGTTGLPKAVMLTHYAVVANALQLGSWVDLHEGFPAMAALPLFHSYGMSTGINAPLFHGAATVLARGDGPAELVENIERHGVRLLVGVPSTVEGLVNHCEATNADISSLEYCFVGAAPLPKVIRKRFNCLTSTRLLEGYGLTEAVTAQSANPRRGTSKPGSIGLPFPDVEFKIVDLETGTKELLPEKAGELAIAGPCLMKGYYNKPSDTAKAMHDGWLYTGDIAWVDHDGYFYVIDRKKDMVTTGVFKAYPAEVEGVLNNNPKVRESAVVGLFDDFRGHSLKAFVVLEPGETASAPELLEYLKMNLSEHKVPRVIEFIDELPKNDIGKILRSELE